MSRAKDMGHDQFAKGEFHEGSKSMSCDRRQFLLTSAGAAIAVSSGGGFAPANAATANRLQGVDSTAGKQKGQLDTALFLDVEDIFSPPELGNDDSIKQLATILTEEKLQANFMVIGDRALVLKERSRKDVIDSLGPHEVGLHTRSARHPEVPEYVAGMTWEAGVAECLKREREGTEIIRDVFGKPCVSLSTHNIFAAPHSQRAAAILGLPYVYASPAAPPLYNLSWYAGALGVPWDSPTLNNKPILCHMEEFDEKYPDDQAFEAHLRKIDRHINTCIAGGQPYLTLFLIHPQRLRLKEFIDNYWCPNGVNYPRERWGAYGRPSQYSREEVEKLLANFRRLVRWIRNDPRLNVMTVPQLAQKYGKQPTLITREELGDAARQIVASDEILIHPRFSPAEILVGLAHGLVAYADHNQLPLNVPRADVLGPTRNPIWIPELQGCDYRALVQLARQLLEHATTTGLLPATLGDPWQRVGINHLYRALAESCLALSAGSTMTEVRFRRIPPWPKIASPVGIAFMKAVEGELMNPDTEVNTLYRDGKLQTWTLKPAVVM